MGNNRRSGKRNKFVIKKNYIVPLVCVIITAFTIIVSTSTIRDLKNKIEVYEQLDTNIDNEYVVKELDEKDKKQIENVFSYIMSNLGEGETLTDMNIRYSLTCKKVENRYEVPEESINSVFPDTYRNLGYYYFDDLKDTYMYVKKEDFIKVYNSMFVNDSLDTDVIKDRYISKLQAYVIPKDLDIYSNSKYVLVDFKTKEDKYIVKLAEINLLQMYLSMDENDVEKYISKGEIEEKYYTGKKLEIEMIYQDNNFVFSKYSI